MLVKLIHQQAGKIIDKTAAAALNCKISQVLYKNLHSDVR
jgi:hypothetical protein